MTNPRPRELLGDKNVISCLQVSSVTEPAPALLSSLSLSLQVLLAAALAVSHLVNCSPVAPPAYPVEAYPDIAPNYNVS